MLTMFHVYKAPHITQCSGIIEGCHKFDHLTDNINGNNSHAASSETCAWPPRCQAVEPGCIFMLKYRHEDIRCKQVSTRGTATAHPVKTLCIFPFIFSISLYDKSGSAYPAVGERRGGRISIT
jgi:hypothetical protein